MRCAAALVPRARSFLAVALPLLFLTWMTPRVTAQTPTAICAIDMGSNSFRRIVGSFQEGRYLQRSIEVRTLGVGDDVARHGRVSDAKLTEIAATLSAFR